jgi:hypothetical protein
MSAPILVMFVRRQSVEGASLYNIYAVIVVSGLMPVQFVRRSSVGMTI